MHPKGGSLRLARPWFYRQCLFSSQKWVDCAEGGEWEYRCIRNNKELCASKICPRLKKIKDYLKMPEAHIVELERGQAILEPIFKENEL